MLATSAIFGWVWIDADRSAEERLISQSETVASSTHEALERVADKLVALAGLFRASETVTRDEFDRFVADIGATPGMEGIGFVTRIPGTDLEIVERQMSEELGREVVVFGIGPSGSPSRVEPGGHHSVLRYLSAPSETWDGFTGFDLRSEAGISATLDAATASGEAASTAFLELLGQPDADNFLMVLPVIDPSRGVLDGFVAALMDSSELVEANISSGLRPFLAWDLEDATGEQVRALEAGVASIDFGGRDWLLEVQPTANSPFLADRIGALVILGLGLIASTLAAIAFFFWRQRVEAAAELQTVRELNAAKDRFIASVSHELRTPLTGILGYAAVLQDEDQATSQGEQREMLHSISQSANDLAHIIDDLLVAARFEIGEISITTVPVSLRAAILDVANGSETAFEVALEIDETGSDMALADPMRVRQIVRNLLENVQRHGGDRVRIRIASDETLVHLEIKDDGPGIPDTVVDTVFEPYQRFHNIIGVTEALGLGLSVSRQLAQLMEGELSYDRRSGWTVFTLTLPTVASQADVRHLPPPRPVFAVARPAGQTGTETREADRKVIPIRGH
ncbi:MAG: ATP-binding protein [Acidimicrobiia bacterium]